MGFSDTPGAVRLHHPDEDIPHFWLTADLSTEEEGNYDAEERLRQADPDLGRRITWDSESGQFFANTGSYIDARKLAELIEKLYHYRIQEVLA